MLHVDLPTRAEIDILAAHRAAPAVSIYIPTRPHTQKAQADRIALKNALHDAITQLSAADIDKREIAPIEDGVSEIINDDRFWEMQANSLAVFAGRDFLRT